MGPGLRGAQGAGVERGGTDGVLTDAGFEAVKITGDLTARAPKDTEDRWIVRCRKPVN